MVYEVVGLGISSRVRPNSLLICLAFGNVGACPYGSHVPLVWDDGHGHGYFGGDGEI